MRNPGALAGATGAYEAGGSHGTPYRREGDMSKIDTKGLGRAARRLAKAGKLPPGVAALKPIPKREAQPRDREGRFSRPPVDPRRETLDSRCRRFGLTPNDDNREIVGSSWMGCDLGFVIEARTSGRDHMHQKARHWDVFSRWSRAEATYRARYLGQGEQPASAALQMIPDRMETDSSATVDLRTPDERDRDAVSSWMRWQGFLGHLPRESRTVLHCARRGDGPALWRDGEPTPAGLVALDALRDLSDVTERRTP